MKIVFISYSFWPPDFGGELLAAIERLQALAQRGDSIAVLTAGHPKLVRSEFRAGMDISRSPSVHRSRSGRALRRIVFWFWAATRRVLGGADVVHFGSVPGLGWITSDLAAFVLCSLAHWRGSRTVVVHSLAESETEIYKSKGWAGYWQKRFYQTVGKVVAVSPALYRGLAADLDSRVELVPYGVRDDVFVRDSNTGRTQLRNAHQACSDDVVFAFLGAVGRRKGFDVLATVFAELAPLHPEWRLWVIGPRNRAESRNIDEQEVDEVTRPLASVLSQVEFFGRVDDRRMLSQVLSASDVFVFPSRREGMGIAPMEAMAVGVPVVIARIPDVTDLANVDGETGLYVTPGDVASLRSALLKLGRDKALREQMGARAAEVVRQKFAWDNHIAQWSEVYR